MMSNFGGGGSGFMDMLRQRMQGGGGQGQPGGLFSRMAQGGFGGGMDRGNLMSAIMSSRGGAPGVGSPGSVAGGPAMQAGGMSKWGGGGVGMGGGMLKGLGQAAAPAPAAPPAGQPMRWRDWASPEQKAKLA